MPPPKSLIFDLDGVLIDSEPIHLRTWLESFEAAGIKFPAGEEARLRGRRGEQVIEWLRKDHGIAIAEPAIGRLLQEKRDRYKNVIQSEVPQVAGAEAFLRRNKGVFPLGLVTSSRLETVGQVMLAMNWRNIFDALIGAQHVTQPKPHPEPYLRAAERFKMRPADCLVFEDSDVGIESARRAGCLVCGVATSLSMRDLYALGADWAIRDFLDEEVLQQCLAGERPGGFARLKRRLIG